MNKKMLLYIVLFISTFGLFAKEETKYTSSTITKDCLNAGHSDAHCKEKATQIPKHIYAYKKARKTYKGLEPKELFKKCFEFAKKKVAK